MHLDNLKIKNFRCYTEAEFNFHPHFNLFIGVNGSGKTSLLEAIAASFMEFSEAVGHSYYPKDQEVVRVIVQQVNNKVRFEKCYPLSLHARGELLRRTDWLLTKDMDNQPARTGHAVPIRFQDSLSNLSNDAQANLPILAFYRANRRWAASNVDAESTMTQRPSRLDAYKNWENAAAGAEELQRWIISKTLERLQRFAENGLMPANHEDELSILNAAVACAIPGAGGLRYDMTLRSLMVDISADKQVGFDKLSDGQRSMIALIADIARRMCLLNPQLGENVLAETDGVIIIDELDIHLHPEWQRAIVRTLKESFPKVQFITASHSPQIVGSLESDEVTILNNGTALHPRSTYGLDSSSILEEIMGASQRAPEVEQMLNDLFSTLESNDIESAKKKLQQLRKQITDLPEFYRAEALIKRKEIIGR